jgi:hypothetical protein
MISVRVLSFGCNWWSRFGCDTQDRYRYTRHAAFYNSSGVRCGNKVRRHWTVPGLVRFNGSGDFNPHYPGRSVGQTFSCTEPVFALGGNRIVFQNQVRRSATPDFFLVVVTSDRFGMFDFDCGHWKSASTYPIAVSHLREKQEALLLMKPNDWVSSNLGRWQLRITTQLEAGAILELAEDGEEG